MREREGEREDGSDINGSMEKYAVSANTTNRQKIDDGSVLH